MFCHYLKIWVASIDEISNHWNVHSWWVGRHLTWGLETVSHRAWVRASPYPFVHAHLPLQLSNSFHFQIPWLDYCCSGYKVEMAKGAGGNIHDNPGLWIISEEFWEYLCQGEKWFQNQRKKGHPFWAPWVLFCDLSLNGVIQSADHFGSEHDNTKVLR